MGQVGGTGDTPTPGSGGSVPACVCPVQAACIPVLLSDGWELPFAEAIDWGKAVVVGSEKLLLQVPQPNPAPHQQPSRGGIQGREGPIPAAALEHHSK